MSGKDIGLWLTIAAMCATCVARFSALEEKQANAMATIVAQSARLDRIEERVRAVEQDRETPRELAKLAAEVAALRAEFRASQGRRGRQVQ